MSITLIPSKDKFLISSSDNVEYPIIKTFDSDNVKVKELYSQKELREFFSSVPFESYRVVNRHVNILR